MPGLVDYLGAKFGIITNPVITQIGAGSALMGNVAIDQTNDGVSNRVVPPFNRQIEKTGTFTPAAAYSVGQNIGTRISIALGIGNLTKFRVARVGLNVPMATNAAVASACANFFNANTGTAVVDAASATWVAADAAALRMSLPITQNMNVTTLAASMSNGTPVGEMATDAGGNTYLVFTANGTLTWTTPGVATWFAEFLY